MSVAFRRIDGQEKRSTEMRHCVDFVTQHRCHKCQTIDGEKKQLWSIATKCFEITTRGSRARVVRFTCASGALSHQQTKRREKKARGRSAIFRGAYAES